MRRADAAAPRAAPDAVPASLDALAAGIDAVLGAAPAPTTVVHPRATPVRRLGLALDHRPAAACAAWVRDAALDAVLVHRAWGLARDGWPDATGVLANHDALDRRLGFGDPPELLAALDVAREVELDRRDDFPLGVVAHGAPRTVAALVATLTAIFGAVEATVAPDGALPDTADASRLAVARAMTPELVARAAAHGARVYVTGQLRQPARAAVRAAGLHVVAVGHARSERWALGVLAAALRARWPGLEVQLAPYEALRPDVPAAPP